MRARMCKNVYMCLRKPEVWNPLELEVAVTVNHHVSAVKGACML